MEDKNGINVLSLFDGISCGQIALERAGIKVNKYFASEIDKYAIEVTQSNYPNTIQIGDVTKIKISDLPKIDILIGGSPCQGFSLAGKQLNFDDPRSKLFFEFVRLKNELSPVYFLLENVKMKKEFQNIISDFLDKQPVEINSSLVSKQNRKRLYWSNIEIQKIEDRNLFLNKYLYRIGHGYIKDEIKFFKKYPTLVAQSPSTKYRIIDNFKRDIKYNFSELRKNGGASRSATPEECEEFQTLPVGYTSNIGKTQRYKCIGNGWTVDVVAHIFKSLQK